MLRVRERAEALDGLADGVVVDAQALLLLDDLALGVDRLREELEVAHAFGLELHREADVRGRHRVVVGGDVLGREGVGLAAHLLEQAGVLLGRDVLGALEHHVLEHVGDAADADALVLRAHVIEDLHRRDGRLVIGEEEHLEAVGEPPRLDVELGRDGGLRGALRPPPASTHPARRTPRATSRVALASGIVASGRAPLCHGRRGAASCYARAMHGTVVVETVDSRALASNTLGDSAVRRVAVWLPPSYARDVTRYYPVDLLARRLLGHGASRSSTAGPGSRGSASGSIGS